PSGLADAALIVAPTDWEMSVTRPSWSYGSRLPALLSRTTAMTWSGTNPPFVGLTLNDGFRMNLPLERLPPDVFKNIYHSLAQFFFYTNQYVTG
ncbi:hypothetical protein, partial [Sphingobium sp.]|uniref:hypothetical protein n=1 Tax=Sphingobium sp. TaxID=1912891 RepID=UPI00257E7D19